MLARELPSAPVPIAIPEINQFLIRRFSMVRVLVLYNKPEDAQAFEQHYRDVHLPLVKTLPGLQRYTVSRNILPADESASYYLVAELDWTDMAALQRAFQSPEGQAIGQDIANNLARLSPGIRTMIYEVEAVQ
jgi:uncharacterized protein (TIGR02118 family)